ncbi:kinesin-like protein KIN-14C isoform X1 [Arachis hypogaea]|uniref:kinesin-like protein KIN-14C isoform X1 n=1 Tax=Arachis hypogaea TaxID=3818 RepID=UPI003B222796
MQASILEIYNETIRDLLSNRPCGIDQTDNSVPDLTIVDVCSVNEVSSLLKQAAQCRFVGRTQMNEQSSRSHFVLTLRICGINEVDSVEKLDKLLAACKALGVETQPMVIGELGIIPLFSWYHEREGHNGISHPAFGDGGYSLNS